MRKGRHRYKSNSSHEKLPPLLSVEEIFALSDDSQLTYTLKVFVAAYFSVMQEVTGFPLGEESVGLLTMCAHNVVQGHTIAFRERDAGC